ncbi:MAG TPA: protoporphyrinogen oxidase [Acidimicrobiales bacterium]|nr:protoporphyrinogen oxidase [Acidimicrobiales bacterium]
MKFAVVGGGIAGLAAAWEMIGPRPSSGGRTEEVPDLEVTVFEPAHLGGKLRTTSFLGRQVDEAPDSLITRVPDGVVLCQELGLEDELVGSAANRAVLFSQGKLQPLPEGLVLGVPSRLLPLVRSRILSPAGVARAALDAVLPTSSRGTDASVFSLVASRFGPEVADRLVGPLLGTIHAADTRQLSAAATAPQLLNAARTSRSLMSGLRRASATGPAPAAGPLFVAPRQGMQSLADRLVERLGDAGARFLPVEASGLRRDGRSVVVEPTGEAFDGVVLATSAPAALSLLEPLLGPSGPIPLATLDFASVAVVTLAFGAEAFEVPADLSGVLVAPGSGLMMTACSFGSNKWPHWAAPGSVVLRVSVGRSGEETWARFDDEALVERLCAELGTVLAGMGPAGLGPGARGRLGRGPEAPPVPVGWRVSRWPRSMPQYEVGHLERVALAKQTIARQAPMVAVAGASYGGVGVPSCIASGRRASRELKAAARSLGLPTA